MQNRTLLIYIVFFICLPLLALGGGWYEIMDTMVPNGVNKIITEDPQGQMLFAVGDGGMILMSKDTARKKGIKPLATLRSIGFAGVDPTIMGQGPVPASRMALEKAGLDAADIDYWEINEAFSIVALNCIKELGIDPDKVNIKGGGIAIGHALGATGIRLTGTLARILELQNGRYGCANACVGGGQGVATVLERD